MINLSKREISFLEAAFGKRRTVGSEEKAKILDLAKRAKILSCIRNTILTRKSSIIIRVKVEFRWTSGKSCKIFYEDEFFHQELHKISNPSLLQSACEVHIEALQIQKLINRRIRELCEEIQMSDTRLGILNAFSKKGFA